MNYRKISAILGIILILIGISMILPLIVSLFYGENDWFAFLITSAITLLTGAMAYKSAGLEGGISNREAIAVVALSWLVASLYGAAPYLLTGVCTSFADAFFETMAGFTTTGASIFTDVEILTHGILLWRSITQWLGGMGIIVLFIAILSSLGAGGLPMYRAELPGGRVSEKIAAISESAKILWYIYLVLTVAETVLLLVLGMPLFDAFCHASSTVSTGGFSTKNASIGFYNNSLIHWVTIIFMFLSGVNFALHYQVFRGKSLKYFWKNAEFRLYFWIIVTAIVVVACDLALFDNRPVGTALGQASFQVVSLITTTGFITDDFNNWPLLSGATLVVMMFIGGCAMSTGGSIKVGRILIMLRQCGPTLRRAFHPRAVEQVKIDGKTVSPEIVTNVLQFFFIFIGVVVLSTLIMTAFGLDLVSAFTTSVAMIGNNGYGLGQIGPVNNYSFLPAASKYYLCFIMLLGRLELYTLLALFMPSFWRK